MATSFHIDVLQGNDYSVNLTATGAAGAALNLSNYTISGICKHRYDTTGFILLNLNPMVVDNNSGTFSININGAALETLPVGVFSYGICLSSGNNLIQSHGGKFTINPSTLW